MTHFLLACVPSERGLAALVARKGYADSPVLAGRSQGPKPALLTEGSANVQLLWPLPDRTNGGTVLLYRGQADGELVVPSDANDRAVGNGSNADLLLFLDEPPNGKKLLIDRGDRGRPRRFERGHVEPDWFPEPHGSRTTRCPLFTRTFASVGGTTSAGYIPVSLAVDDQAAATAPVAVLNPLVFRVALRGAELGGNAGDGRVTFESVLRDVNTASRGPGGVLLVEPVIPADLDPRVRALDAVAAGTTGPGPRSVVGQLLFGPAGEPDWLPFLCLDLLENGRFRLDHPATAGDHWRAWGFRRDAAPAANSVWFANYWAERWGGRVLPADEPEPVVELPPDERNPASREEYVSANLRLTRAEADAAYADCGTFLAAVRPDGFLGWVSNRSEFALTRQHQEYFRRDQPKGGRVSVSWKQEGLMQALSREFLFPRSPVLVQPPPADRVPDPARRPAYERALSGKWFDLEASVRWFARDFAQRLTGPAPAPPGPIPWRENWWAVWYDHLFRPGAGPDFTFGADDSGFVTGESFLGLDDVLGGGAAYEQGELIVL